MRQLVHGAAVATVAPSQRPGEQCQQHRERDDHRLQAREPPARGELAAGGFLLAREQGVLLVLGGAVELDAQRCQALVELAPQQGVGGGVELELLLVRALPVAHVHIRGGERPVRRGALGQRIRAHEDLDRLVERREALAGPAHQAQGDAALHLQVGTQTLVGKLALDPCGPVEQHQGLGGRAAGVAHAGQAAQGVGLAARVAQLARERQHLLESALRAIPVLQVLEHSRQVVLSDGLLAQHAHRLLLAQGELEVLAGLLVVAQPVVHDGDAVDRQHGLLGQPEALEQGVGALQIHQAGGELALQSEQVAAAVERFGQELVVAELLGDRDGLLIEGRRLGVVARVFVDLALAGQEPGAQRGPAQGLEVRLGKVELAQRSVAVALGVVLAQLDMREHAEVGIGLLGQAAECLFGEPPALFGIATHRRTAALEQGRCLVGGRGSDGRRRNVGGARAR